MKMEQDNNNNKNNQFQQMVENFLRLRSASSNDTGAHLDDDSLAAFVEGDLSARENNMFMGHLSDCGFCLHKTAELAELQTYFASEEQDFAPAAETQPIRISEVLSGLFSRLFGNFDTGETVFAHEEKKEDKDASEESPD
jgi:hypothetical protein